MRGRVHCRPHLDHELGPRGAGAPRGNLNAFKTGANINPFSKAQIQRIAHSLAQDPDRFQEHLVDLVKDLSLRVGDGYGAHDANSPAHPDILPPALKALIALDVVLHQLISLLAEDLFTAEMDDILKEHPPARQADVRARLWAAALPVPPLRRLVQIRSHRARNKKK
ncbi:MAG TPA: hypothetical protein VLE70_17890 [Anaerolineae bacterium]|jgi:hypothetical protein|nr:hypothetical protein [Anaerolineae bacterium]